MFLHSFKCWESQSGCQHIIHILSMQRLLFCLSSYKIFSKENNSVQHLHCQERRIFTGELLAVFWDKGSVTQLVKSQVPSRSLQALLLQWSSLSLLCGKWISTAEINQQANYWIPHVRRCLRSDHCNSQLWRLQLSLQLCTIQSIFSEPDKRCGFFGLFAVL